MAGVTFIDVPPNTPTEGLMTSVGDPVTAQLSVLVWPAVTVAGVAAKLVIVGALPAVTVTEAVVDPKVFVAVRVYNCVVDGVTLAEVPVTAPTPGLRIRLGDPVTDQLSVLACPAITFDGVAVKPVIVGGRPTITVSEAVVDPESLIAVSV